MSADYEMETLYQIWNNGTGERIEVGFDRDGLQLIEIRSYDSLNKCNDRLTFTHHQAHLIAQALNKLAGEQQK